VNQDSDQAVGDALGHRPREESVFGLDVMGITLGDDGASMDDHDAVGEIEIVGFRRLECVVEQRFEGCAVDARIELGVGPDLGGPWEILGLGRKGEEGRFHVGGVAHGREYSFGEQRV
jgi:hypothetical protein